MFQAKFREMSMVFQEIFNGGLSSFKVVSRVFERSLKGVSGKVQWCFKEVSKIFKVVSRVLQESFKGILRKVWGCFKGD